jgi:hypothetical protein
MAERRFCGACNDTGVNEEGKTCICLINCAERLLKQVSRCDPMWAERIRITREEQGFDAWQFIGAQIGYMLDNGLHMHAPNHPAFLPQREGTAAQGYCGDCGKEFKAQWPGQRLCMPCSQIPPKALRAPLLDTPLPEPIAQSELLDDIA